MDAVVTVVGALLVSTADFAGDIFHKRKPPPVVKTKWCWDDYIIVSLKEFLSIYVAFRTNVTIYGAI